MPPKTVPRIDVGLAPSEGYFTFRPRDDQPDRYDEQTAFYYSRSPGVAFFLGGNGAGTTECALAKVAKFILADQEPPRHDTPFWVISDTYETVCEAAWKEKLLGHGHIPAAEIDQERIQWHKPLRGWPTVVPLKPWPSTPGRNWVLEFKSYKQGRHLMQARSIGGFCFIEQFPWILLTEVLRGCREYSFLGNKLCEFTPIVPGLTEELEEMIDRDELPVGWEVFRSNTQCALEAGHVSREWFDTFFAMVPESMRATRMIGAMPTYEGAIYSGFNPKVHCIEITDRPFPKGAQHRRWIDWGSGPENPFVCLWAYKNGLGQWFVYDEYYSNDLTRTVIDHLSEVAGRWPWPKGNPHYGTTWADPSGTAYLRIASRFSEYCKRKETVDGHGQPITVPLYDNISIAGANNSVFEGIEHVQYLLKPAPGIPAPFPDMPMLPGGYPRLFFDRDNCRNCKREMRTYRWDTKNPNAINPKDKKAEPLKANDHTCIALGEPIDIPLGNKPIESLRPGDLVFSHLGICAVDGGPIFMGEKSVVRLELDDGRDIFCTADHPIRTSTGLWIEAGDSRGCEITVRHRHQGIRRPIETETATLWNAWSTQDLLGGDIQNRDFTASHITAEARGMERENFSTFGCTKRSGKTTMGRFPADSSFTIRTRTTAITIPKIYPQLQNRGTPKIIGGTWPRQLPKPGSGTHRLPVESGTKNTAHEAGKTGKTGDSIVRAAENHFGLETEAGQRDFAVAAAGTMLDCVAGSTTFFGRAISAETAFQLTATNRRKLAPINVETSYVVAVQKIAGTTPVFNLATTDGAFFVNGILVSNCDAIRYGTFSEAEFTVGDFSSLHRADRSEDFGVIMHGRGRKSVQLKRGKK